MKLEYTLASRKSRWEEASTLAPQIFQTLLSHALLSWADDGRTQHLEKVVGDIAGKMGSKVEAGVKF